MNFEIKGTVKGGSLSVGGTTFESVEALEKAYPAVIDIINVRTTTKLVKTRIRVEASIDGQNCSIYIPLRCRFKDKVKQAAIDMGLVSEDAVLHFNFIGNSEQLCKNLNVLR